MSVEIPVFTKCCGCIPLRCGLLALTYIRIIYLIAAITVLIPWLIETWYEPLSYNTSVEIAFTSILIIWLVLDIVFNIVFIVGGHTKNVKLIKVQYYYNLVSLVLYVLLCIAFIVVYWMGKDYSLFRYYYDYILLRIVYQLSYCFAGIVIQTYVLLLTRSEIRKLTLIKNVELGFVNNRSKGFKKITDRPGFVEIFPGLDTKLISARLKEPLVSRK